MSPRWRSPSPSRRLPRGKHIGALPSQQPPDWWNISAPWRACRRAMSASAASVATTCATAGTPSSMPCAVMASPRWRMEEAPRKARRPAWSNRTRRSEEPECLLAVGHQQVLRLLVVVQHHLVVLAPDARLLVAAEGRVRRVRVVAVRPHAARLDATAHAERGVHVA